jgi:hypothetical protein
MRVALILLILLPSSMGLAETYRWVDEKGTINFTQDYESVPGKYRDQVKEKPAEAGEKAGVDKAPQKPLEQDSGKGLQKSPKKGSKEASPKSHGDKEPVNKNRLESDAADALTAIITLWKDGKYEALYEYGTDRYRTTTSREKFVERMKHGRRDLASSWETLRDVDAKFRSPTLVYVTAKIGTKTKTGGNVRFQTETFEMRLEKGTWKTDLSKLLKTR